MNNTTFDYKTIMDIKLEQDEKESFWVEFRIGAYFYEMPIKKRKDLQFNVYHQTSLDRKNCPFCPRHSSRCHGLMEHTEGLFHYFTTHPSLRLLWLTSEHVFRVEREEV